MAVTAVWFGQSFLKALNKEIDVDTDTLKCMLLTSTATPSQDTWVYKSDVTNEVVGTGYTATGATLASVTLGYTAGTNVIKFDAADVSWTTSTITARYAIIYDSTPGSDATRPLMILIDFGADVISTAGTFSIAFDAAGIATITPAA